MLRASAMSATVAAVAGGSLPAESATAPGNPADAQLDAFLDAEWAYALRSNPEFASSQGDRSGDDKWQDVSLAAQADDLAHGRDALARLQRIDRAALGEAGRLNYDLYAQQLRDQIRGDELETYLFALNQRGGVQTDSTIVDLLTFESVRDFEALLARIDAWPRKVDQTLEVLAEAVRRKYLWPRVVMTRVVAQIERLNVAPDEHPFYAPFKALPASIGSADAARLREAARTGIARAVLPAQAKLGAFMSGTYLPAAPVEVGLSRVPNGEALYAYFLRTNTTTGFSAERIHALGLQEVARIRAARAQPYGVFPIPDAIAPDTTTAYYQPGSLDGLRAGGMHCNLYKPETRPIYEMPVLTLHEAVPGHHVQFALGSELGTLPNFRRIAYYVGYSEGWALYAESLGDRIGVYDSPKTVLGAQTYDMWRAVRLVVDTGMHAFGWSRERSIAYFLDNAAKTELDVTNEIDRYITDPGQACSYKLGQLQIFELRDRAQAKLGAKFDLRAFHAVVLGAGSIPLDVLRARVDAWLETA